MTQQRYIIHLQDVTSAVLGPEDARNAIQLGTDLLDVRYVSTGRGKDAGER